MHTLLASFEDHVPRLRKGGHHVAFEQVHIAAARVSFLLIARDALPDLHFSGLPFPSAPIINPPAIAADHTSGKGHEIRITSHAEVSSTNNIKAQKLPFGLLHYSRRCISSLSNRAATNAQGVPGGVGAKDVGLSLTSRLRLLG